MTKDSGLRRLRWLLVLPGIALSTLLFLFAYWISCTSIFPSTLLLSFLYEDTHGKVGASELVGTYTGLWGEGTDTLTLYADGHFAQRAIPAEGKAEDLEGTWDYSPSDGVLELKGRLDLSDSPPELQRDEAILGPMLEVPKNRMDIEIGDEGTYQAENSVRTSPLWLRFTGSIFNAIDYMLGKPNTPPLAFW